MVSAVTAPAVDVDPAAVQRRTLRLLFVTQVLGGIGIAIGLSVGALLAADMAGVRVSGLVQSSFVVGGALLTVPLARLMQARGRRPGLSLAFAVGAVGAVGVVAAAGTGSVPLLFLALFLFGGANTANYQARYAAVDLADPARRGRQLSFVVWATTIGAVAGPNLAPAAEEVLDLPRYSAPFAFSAVAFLVAGLALVLLLRPDPLLTARIAQGVSGPDPAAPDALGLPDRPPPAGGTGIRAAWREVIASPPARLGMAAVAMGHLVMVGVMSMTPVHIGETHEADVLRIVGVVLSLHIAGMYAFSPVTGWLTDRVGRRPVILGGIALLLAACAVAGTAGHDTVRLAVGLTLLGMGWSGTMVAGSTLLSESVGLPNKPAVQGLSDLVMGLAGAGAGALSGVVVAWSGYATLTALAAVATVPLAALALRPVRVLAGGN
ncbi:MAG TPA: MFS transporter [Micromonosporaceae bacterium]|jgi:MFS family permease|nr:MFS transporter [Micromonosporaceae bacterium]